MVEVASWHIGMWMLSCLLSGAAIGIAYAGMAKNRTGLISSIDVADQVKNTHLGTIRVAVVLGWKFKCRLRLAMALFRLGAVIAPARIDVEQD